MPHTKNGIKSGPHLFKKNPVQNFYVSKVVRYLLTLYRQGSIIVRI